MPIEGFLLINKPEGLSSYDVIRYLKPIVGKEKMGHSGTLDPFASGLLLVAIGSRYTKQLASLQNLDKRYEFRVVFGIETDSLDCDGVITQVSPASNISEDMIQTQLPQFIGEQQQMPPQFSAKKKNGKKAYELARAGQHIELDPVNIHIHEFTLLSFKTGDYPIAEFDVSCSKGTYIRSLATDLAASFGTVAYTKSLKRTQIGPFLLENSHELSSIHHSTVQSLCQYELLCSN
jgi:tRNA pseudouridine55 synthase